MATKTNLLIDKIAEKFYILEYPSASWDKEALPVQMFFRAKARVAVKACKEAGLKFTAIEEWEEHGVSMKLHKITGEIELE